MKPELTPKLRQIVNQLNGLQGPASLDLLRSILSGLEIDRSDVEGFCTFNPLCYARNPVAATEHYELLCICWLPGQSSLIHDHTGSACGVRVVAGELTETIFEHVSDQWVRPVRTNYFATGYVCGSYDREIHQISNFQDGERELITLHIYSPPLARMNSYVNAEESAAYSGT